MIFEIVYMEPLYSVDLFTGLGGFTLAMKDLACPVLYCDNDARVIELLEKNMDRSAVPRAPIVKDVDDLDGVRQIVGRRRVDLVTAGFPCIGFSKRGKRHGLENSESALFHSACKIIADLKPCMVFFENVAEILSANDGGDMRDIWKVMSGLGYSMRWTVRSASDVGALHDRKRWFCLCVRAQPPKLTASRVGEPKKRSPKLITSDSVPGISRRMEMLGNALVPMCARLAFFSLFTGFEIKTINDMEGQTVTYASKPVTYQVTNEITPKHFKHAEFTTRGVMNFDGDLEPTKLNAHIIVDPQHYATIQKYVDNPMRPIRSPPILHTIALKSWPTPRKSSVTHSHNLSARTLKDLPTAAMYASSVGKQKQPKTADGQRLNPRYVEWLMGYPLDFTKI